MSGAKCKKRTIWGRCGQPPSPTSEKGLCLSHDRWASRDVTPDPFYERKIVLNLTQPVDTYCSSAEIEASLNGRYRGDGRRIDVYAPPEGPLGISL